MKAKGTILGSIIAIILATSCCWLPALILGLGGGSTLLALSSSLESMSGVLFALGSGLLIFGMYQIYRSSVSRSMKANLESVIECPECGHRRKEIMPQDACQYFYECHQCKTVLKPLPNDCCVFCSYGTEKCPPVQKGAECC